MFIEWARPFCNALFKAWRVPCVSLDNQYAEYEALAGDAVLVQAKTYFGGGIWYTLDIDYERVAKIFKTANYKDFISAEFEGKEDW